jgi:hypothetical protein
LSKRKKVILGLEPGIIGIVGVDYRVKPDNDINFCPVMPVIASAAKQSRTFITNTTK